MFVFIFFIGNIKFSEKMKFFIGFFNLKNVVEIFESIFCIISYMIGFIICFIEYEFCSFFVFFEKIFNIFFWSIKFE